MAVGHVGYTTVGYLGVWLFPCLSLFYFWLHQAQLELLHEKAGQHTVMVRRSFPAFDSIGGLRMALSIKIKVRGCPTLSFVPPSCVPRNVFPSFNDCSLPMIHAYIYNTTYEVRLFPDVVHVRWGEAREQTKRPTPVQHEHYICGCRAMLSLPLITTACAHPLNRSSSPPRCAICFIYLSIFAGSPNQEKGGPAQGGRLEHRSRPHGSPLQLELPPLSSGLGQNRSHLRVSCLPRRSRRHTNVDACHVRRENSCVYLLYRMTFGFAPRAHADIVRAPRCCILVGRFRVMLRT